MRISRDEQISKGLKPGIQKIHLPCHFHLAESHHPNFHFGSNQDPFDGARLLSFGCRRCFKIWNPLGSTEQNLRWSHYRALPGSRRKIEQGLAGKSNSILKRLLYQFNGLGCIMLYPILIDCPAPEDPQIRCSGWWFSIQLGIIIPTDAYFAEGLKHVETTQSPSAWCCSRDMLVKWFFGYPPAVKHRENHLQLEMFS